MNARRPWATKPQRTAPDADPELTRLRELAVAEDLRCRKTGTPAQVHRVAIPEGARGSTPSAPTSRIEYACPACGVSSTGTWSHFGQAPPGRAEEDAAEVERLAAAGGDGEDGGGEDWAPGRLWR